MHSGSILLLWLFFVVLIQKTAGGMLALITLTCLSSAFIFARQRTVHLLKRARLFLLAIMVFFVWFTPGEAIFLQWPVLSPTQEGLHLCLIHTGRLVAVICCVAILLQCLTIERLVSGLYALCHPLSGLGLSPERLALRLMLTLRYVEGNDLNHKKIEPKNEKKAGKWMLWLNDDLESNAEEIVLLTHEHYRYRDVFVLVLILVLSMWWLIR